MASPAWAQSSSLLDLVRVHDDLALKTAQRELEACSAQPSCHQLERLSLLTGLLLLSANEAEAAVAQLTAVPSPKGLEPFHSWYLAEALAWAHRPAEALAKLGQLRRTAPATLEARVRHRVAELSVEVGDLGTARSLLEADPAVTRSPELLWSRSLARRGLTSKELQDLRALVVRFPAHPHAELARQRLELLRAPPLTAGERITQARALGAAGRLSDALEAIEALPESPALMLLRGQLLLDRGSSQSQAIELLRRVQGGASMVAAEATLTLARHAMRGADRSGARSLFATLVRQWPEHPNADEAAYLSAWLAMSGGDLSLAITEFEAFELAFPQSTRREEARWFRAFSMIRAKRAADARVVLDELLRDFPSSSLVPQAQYWAARCRALEQPDGGTTPGEAEKAYQRLVTSAAGSLYGVLAAARLAELGQRTPTPFATVTVRLDVELPAALQLAHALSEAGLFADAAREVTAAASHAPPARALEWGHALQTLGAYGPAHALAMRRLWSAVYGQRDPRALALTYPRAYEASVTKWAAAHQVESELVWAIMRRESTFLPDVTSTADARGLLQLIPPTAAKVTSALGLPPTDPAALYGPDWNVRLGTWYLHALLERFQHPALVAAAYNAGPSAVASWLEARPDAPLDEWIEQIPYKETRSYVKQVLADVVVYRSLSGRPLELPSLTLPPPRPGVDF